MSSRSSQRLRASWFFSFLLSASCGHEKPQLAAPPSSGVINSTDLVSALENYTVGGVKVGAAGAFAEVGRISLSDLYARIATGQKHRDVASIDGYNIPDSRALFAAERADRLQLQAEYPNFAALMKGLGVDAASVSDSSMRAAVAAFAATQSLSLDDGSSSNADPENNGAQAQTAGATQSAATGAATSGKPAGWNDALQAEEDKLLAERDCNRATSAVSGIKGGAVMTAVSTIGCALGWEFFGFGLCGTAGIGIASTALSTRSPLLRHSVKGDALSYFSPSVTAAIRDQKACD